MSTVRPRLPRRLLAIEAGALLLAIALALPTADAIPPALFGVPVLVYGWLGARIAERAPTNPVGWCLSTAALTAAMALLLVSYGRFGVLHGTGPVPFREPLTLLNAVVPLPVIGGSLLLAFMLFPTGTLPSRRWRAAPVIVVVSGIVTLVISLLRELDAIGGKVAATLDVVIVVSLGLSALATVGALIVRSRRGTPEERAPIRGLLFTLLAMAVAFALFAFRITQVEWDLWIVLSFVVIMLGTLAGIPFVLSVAMLRYGLFDYEVGIRKRIAARVLATLVILALGVVLFLVASSFGGTVLTGEREGTLLAIVVGAVTGAVLVLGARWAWRFAERVVFRDRATPYEVLSEFTERVGETYSLDDVLPRMTQLLARGTGASSAAAWVEVDGRLRAVSSYPEGASHASVEASGDDLRTDDPATHAYPVRRGGGLLGALSVTMPTNDPMNEAKERLARELAAQAGLVLQNVALLEDVRESRRRIVAAQDERARALERNIHDGAQQQLVALTVKLRLAEQLAERDPAGTAATLRTLQDDATAALEDLRDLARGIYPPLLADQGLAAALEAQARKAALPVDVEARGVGRHRRDIESVVYFSCLEALSNTAKYAGATRAIIRLDQEDGLIRLEVADDGCGFDPDTVARGTGLQGIEDRVEAIGGTLEVRSAPGEGTRVLASVPAAPANDDPA
jgi:signal transduction histidine kinase